MDKTLIDPKDIRKGDLVRVESSEDATDENFSAMEYTALHDGHELPLRWPPGQYFLLERPETKYELPTKPGVYTIAKYTADIPGKRVFMLDVYHQGWWEDGSATFGCITVSEYLLNKKWPLKRLVIDPSEEV